MNPFRSPLPIKFALPIAIAVFFTIPANLEAQQTRFKPWVSSYQEALKQSRQSGKPVMLYFTGSDWSNMSQRMSTEVLASREFAKWSSSNVIKVEVDFPKTIRLPQSTRKQNNQILNRYRNHVSVYPTVLFIDANEKVLGKCNYQGDGARNWVMQAGRVLYRKVDKVAGIWKLTPTGRQAS